jgi:hypothetical protein
MDIIWVKRSWQAAPSSCCSYCGEKPGPHFADPVMLKEKLLVTLPNMKSFQPGHLSCATLLCTSRLYLILTHASIPPAQLSLHLYTTKCPCQGPTSLSLFPPCPPPGFGRCPSPPWPPPNTPTSIGMIQEAKAPLPLETVFAMAPPS